MKKVLTIFIFLVILTIFPQSSYAKTWYPSTKDYNETYYNDTINKSCATKKDGRTSYYLVDDDPKNQSIVIDTEEYMIGIRFGSSSDMYWVRLKIINKTNNKIYFTKNSLFIRDDKGLEYPALNADDIIQIKYGGYTRSPAGTESSSLGAAAASGMMEGFAEGMRQNFVSLVKNAEFTFGEIAPTSETREGCAYFAVTYLKSPVTVILNLDGKQHYIVFQEKKPSKNKARFIETKKL